MNKKILGATSLLCAGVMTAGLAGCGGEAKTNNSVLSLDINPSLQLVLDDKNVVVSVCGTNEDGQILLYGETDKIVGKSVDEALDAITNSAVELGYLSEENKVVQFTVSSAKGEKTAELLADKVTARVTAKAGELGLTVETDAEAAYSLMRRYEAFKAEHPKTKIDVESFRLALTASESGKISLEAAVELSDEELITAITEASADVKEYSTKAYNAAKAEAFRIYDKAAQTALDNVYSVYYMKNIAAHPQTFYYGSSYSLYCMSAHTLDAIADASECAAKVTAYALDEAQIKAAAQALGIEEAEIDKLKDASGNITIDSVEAYANKLFKNSPASAELERAKTELSAALNEAESEIQKAIDTVSEEYAEEIDALTQQAEQTVALLKTKANTILTLMPDAARQSIEDLAAIMERTAELGKDGFTVSEIRTLADEFEKKADETLKLIEKDLSADEKQEVEQMKTDLEATVSKARQTMEAALKTAEDKARETLAAMKEARKQA